MPRADQGNRFVVGLVALGQDNAISCLGQSQGFGDGPHGTVGVADSPRVRGRVLVVPGDVIDEEIACRRLYGQQT